MATRAPFARFVAEETRQGRALDLDDLIVLRSVTDRGWLDRWLAAECLQLLAEDAAERLVSLRERGYVVAQGRGRGTAYRLARALSDRLRRPGEPDRDALLDDAAVRLRVQAVLSERGRFTNADVRRMSGYSRTEALRMMRALAEENLVQLEGHGRGAHYVPGSRLAQSRGRRRKCIATKCANAPRERFPGTQGPETRQPAQLGPALAELTPCLSPGCQAGYTGWQPSRNADVPRACTGGRS